MTPRKDHVRDDGRTGKYFTLIYNMADDDLNPYQYRLLGHYKRVCGDSDDGACWESTRTTGKKCQMSTGKVSSTRLELQTMGYVSIEQRPNDTLRITLIDRMAENVSRYAKQRSSGEHGVHEVNTHVHGMNGRVHEVKQRITNEEEPLKNKENARADETSPSMELLATSQAAQNTPPVARRPPKAKRDLTETEVWQRRLDTVLPITTAMLAKMEQGYDPAFSKPHEYMTLALLQKYVPVAEGLGFLKMSPEQFFKLWGEIEAEYKPKGWKIALKTIDEKAPSFMLRIRKAEAASANGIHQAESPPIEVVTLTPEEIAARKAAIAAARTPETPEVA